MSTARNHPTTPDADLCRTLDFLNNNGIPCTVVPNSKGFIAGVKIVFGCLEVDPKARVSNVLHEAGHLAVLPGRFRRQANIDIDAVIEVMVDSVDFSNPDVGEARAAMQAGDTEATAWAWAAGMAIGLRPEKVIHSTEYDGTGAEVRISLQTGSYIGISGLAAAGFCVTRLRLEAVYGLPSYPRLGMWLQKNFVESADVISCTSVLGNAACV